jgi:hypothetical protein
MKTIHHQTRITFILGLALLVVTNSQASTNFTTDAALQSYNSRTFLPDSETSVWRSSIDSVIGTYVYQNGNVLDTAGRPTGLPITAKKVDLKSSFVFKNKIEGEFELEGSIAGFLKAGRSKSTMDEIIVEEIVSITDDAVNLEWCQQNTPASFGPTTRYWCVSGVTLTKVTVNRFTKAKKLAEGNYGIVNAKGTWKKDDSASGEYYRANVSLRGPFVNKVHVPAVPFLPPADEVTVKNMVSKDKYSLPGFSSITGKKSTGLESISTGLERATIPIK